MDQAEDRVIRALRRREAGARDRANDNYLICLISDRVSRMYSIMRRQSSRDSRV